MDVYFTVDVEFWPSAWDEIDREFPERFRRYVYGPTPRGDYGLPFTLELLGEFGLPAVFFVETLFSARCGKAPLEELLGVILDSGQEVQLHAHTEWVDEVKDRVLERPGKKRRHFGAYSTSEQTQIISVAKQIFLEAGGAGVGAFRAGSFSMDASTIQAVANSGIAIDCSYNQLMSCKAGQAPRDAPYVDYAEVDGVLEIPMTVFRDGIGRLRHTQIGACSTTELERLLWQAKEAGRQSFVLLSHNFETMNRSMTRPDDVVVERVRHVFQFLSENRDVFNVRGMTERANHATLRHAKSLQSSFPLTMKRMVEQLARVRY